MPRSDDKLLEGNLDTVLLSVLAAGASYGYQILVEAERRTGGRLRVRENALYPALHRLERQGLLDAEWRTEQARRRRYYRLTERGQQELSRRRARWREFAAAMDAALGEA